MRSIPEQSTPARIRDCALALFAERGYAATSLRAIGEKAGVAPGLVIHHFTSKEGLRDACDAHVVRRLLADKAGGALDVAALAAQFDATDDAPPLMGYLRQMLGSNSEAASDVFDRLVASTAALLTAQQQAGDVRADIDVAALAPVLTVYGLAPVMMPGLLARGLGASALVSATLEAAAAQLGPILAAGLYARDKK